MKIKSVVIFLFSIVMSGQVLAQDARVFPANWCRDNFVGATNLAIEPASVWSNTPDVLDSDFAICPILTTRTSQTLTFRLATASVFVVDNSSVDNFKCRVVKVAANGSTYFHSVAATSGVGASTLQLVSSGGLFVVDGEGIQINCEVPGKTPANLPSFLRWYRISQDEY